jgi:hypothetical protein
MVEKDLENALAAILREGSLDRSALRDVRIVSGTTDATSIYDLVDNHGYVLFQDTNDWNHEPKLMIDVAGGITPDLVLRSTATGENRIYIEVKSTEGIRDAAPLSQIVRQFLHLLATSRHSPSAGRHDIRRAILLAAPSAWFAKEANVTKWRYFLDKYADLARLPKVDITLGELRLDAFV